MTLLELKYRKVEELAESTRNVRKHSSKQTHQLASSIKTFGFNAPILIDEEDRVLAGHARLAAAKAAGLATVPTITLSHLKDPAARRAFMLADNKIALNATWDAELLRLELRELADLDLSFDLEITGFSTTELDLAIDGPTASVEAENALPALQVTATSRLGDIWRLGEHRLLCGNAREWEHYAKLMDGEHARMAFADPPYNVRIDGHVSGNGEIRHREFVEASGEMTPQQYVDFLRPSFVNMARASLDGAIHFICMDWRHMSELWTATAGTYPTLLNLCVWNKDNGGLGSFYRSKHELVFVYKVGTASHLNTIELGKHGRYRTNVWDYAGANSFRAGRDEELEMHPTVKPVALVIDAIKDCTRRGDLVLDPFLGSGTTIIAADKSKRLARAIEIDPLYVDVAVRRWQAFKGQDATLEETGETFAEAVKRRVAGESATQ